MSRNTTSKYSSVLLYESRHVCVDPVRQRIKSEKAQHILNIIVYLIVMVFVSCLLYYGARQTIHLIPQSWASLPGMSMAWVYLAVPLGAFFMLLQSLKVVVDNCVSLSNLNKGQGGNRSDTISCKSICTIGAGGACWFHHWLYRHDAIDSFEDTLSHSSRF